MAANEASRAQNQASSPKASCWVSANAGSGKTKVLTDRVARLLLEGAPPGKILCLTYTKAAAAEMQNRLFARLGEWSMLSDESLAGRLSELGAESQAESPDCLREARTLFARALETPGGLKIQTIHSFCGSLLRRFPLEARVSPQFREMDERATRELLDAAIDEMAADSPGTVGEIASILPSDSLAELAQDIMKNRGGFLHQKSRERIRAALGLRPGSSEETIIDAVFTGDEPTLLEELLEALGANPQKTSQSAAESLRRLRPFQASLKTLEGLEGIFLYSSGEKAGQAKTGRFPPKAAGMALGARLADLSALMERVEASREDRLMEKAAQSAEALHEFATGLIQRYDRMKRFRGWLDFDDLIQKSRELLGASEMAQWILFRLDGGIDHILVDEAQDTSPAQWDVIAKISEEFMAGAGAREDVNRTIFVVGDEKQSIYSFQGADPREFGRMMREFQAKLKEAGSALQRSDLVHSFRSAEPILRLVDQTFHGAASKEFRELAGHKAFHESHPGRAELWPLVPRPEKPKTPGWTETGAFIAAADQEIALAREVARKTQSIISSGELVPKDGGLKPLDPGDILILVQSRNSVFERVIRTLKELGLPVAGSDRLRICDELAVKDLMSLLRFLSTPADSLSLAEALRSPLVGLSENGLFQLAHGRGGRSLWSALREKGRSSKEIGKIHQSLSRLLGKAKILAPFELLELILTVREGRQRLIARLGLEAEEGIDALVEEALKYEAAENPSLAGFLDWLDRDSPEIKRQLDSGGGQIRVMTVHGAKGLESPVVILPDTTGHENQPQSRLIKLGNGALVWRGAARGRPKAVQQAVDDEKASVNAEKMRLLYVAMTRAKHWLIACGIEKKAPAQVEWHDLIKKGMEKCGAQRLETGLGGGLAISNSSWSEGERGAASEAREDPLPKWTQRAKAKPAKGRAIKNAWELGGRKVLRPSGESAKYESWLRALLERLPGIDPASWESAAEICLENLGDQPDPKTLEKLLLEARAVAEEKSLARLFGESALAEAEMSAELPRHSIAMRAAVNRLVVEPEKISAFDFKAAKEPREIPEGLLRQMGACQETLREIYPDRAVETALVWTKSRTVTLIDPKLAREALERALKA